MIRANLMPVEARGTTVFGIRLEIADIWRSVAAVVAALLLTLPVVLIFDTVEHHDEDELAAVNARLSQLSGQTNDVGALSSNTKRLQEIDREAAWLKSSGQVMAIRMVTLGNAVPEGVWLDHLAQDRTGWQIDGGGKSLNSMSMLLGRVAATSPGLQTGFSTITDSGRATQGYTFKASVTRPSPTPGAVQQ